MVGRCTVCLGGVLCYRAIYKKKQKTIYCVVGWCTVLVQCTASYGCVLCGRAIYCVLG